MCVPSTPAECTIIPQPKEQKVVGGNYNVLIQYVDTSAPSLEDAVLCNPFKYDILLFILVKNLVVCVPSTTADCNLFNNNRNRNVVGGNHNVLVYYKTASAPDPDDVVICYPFK